MGTESNRPRRNALGQADYNKMLKNTALNVAVSEHPPPEEIEVPNHNELYAKDQPGGFSIFRGTGGDANVRKFGLEPLHDEGWKLHLPLPTSRHLCPVGAYYWGGDSVHERPCLGFRSVFHYLQKISVPHKFYPTLSMLEKMKNKDPNQAGKFLTIYPNDEKQMMEVIAVIDNLLHELVCLGCFEGVTFAPNDKPVGSHRVITARYGVCTWGDNVLMKKEEIKGVINEQHWGNCSINEETFKQRSYKPDHIRDPWNKDSEGESGWYDHPKNGPTVVTSRKGMVYDSATRRWVKKDGMVWDPETQTYVKQDKIANVPVTKPQTKTTKEKKKFRF
jgi:hypothetical protein